MIQIMTEYLLASVKQIFLLPDSAKFRQSNQTTQQTTFQKHASYKQLSPKFYIKDMDVDPYWDVELEYLARSIKSTECSYVAAQKFLFLALLKKSL
jgi:hypothetical protein